MNVSKSRNRHYALSILKVLPVPSFLEMHPTGIDISDTHVRCISFTNVKHGFAIKNFSTIELPQGLIQGGDVQDSATLSKILAETAKKYEMHFVRVSVPEEKAYLFKTTIPRVPSKELAGAIEFRLEENVPIPLSEVVFDYVIAESDNDHKDHYDVEIAVLPKKIAESYVDIFKNAGLQTASFMIEAQAIMRALVPRGNKSTALIINLETSKTGLYVVSDEVVHFASSVAIGGATITNALEKHLKLSSKEAEALKFKEGLERHHGNDELFFALMTPLSALKDEIKRIITYWENHDDEKQEKPTIGEIILCGKDAQIAGLRSYLQESLKKPVSVGNVWINVLSLEENIPPIPYEDALDYAGAIGAALPRTYFHV